MNVVGIACSPHRDGMTASLLTKALAGAESAGAETSILFLTDEKLLTCLGCGGNCWGTLACTRDGKTPATHAALQEADGIVMAVPVYCWEMNGLTHLFVDRMRWNTGSVLKPRNPRAAFGIACAGGSGTGCVMALQALYRYFYNWAFHGIAPLPVTRFNFDHALDEAYRGGEALAHAIRSGLAPYKNLGEAMAALDALPYMRYGALDELSLIVQQLWDALPEDPTLRRQAALADEAMAAGDTLLAAGYLDTAYEAGLAAWDEYSGHK